MSAELLQDLERRKAGAVSAFENELKGLRTGRANAALLDVVRVEAYGQMMPLSQLATVSVPEARLLSVQVWDQSMVQLVEKAIGNSNLGLNPAVDGGTVRVPLPELTEERRKELVKVAQQYGEKAKISVRNVRRDGMDELKKMEKNGDISEDELRGYSDDVQKLTDTHIGQIDQAVSSKTDEILAV